MASSSGEDTFDPTVPPEKQKVTYQTKDGKIKTVTKAELQEQMETSEKLMQSLNETWEEKMARTQEVQREREKALEELGITVEKNNVGVHTPKRVSVCLHGEKVEPDCTFQMPHLVNLVSFLSFSDGASVQYAKCHVVLHVRMRVGIRQPSLISILIFETDPLMSECLIYQIKPGKTIVCRWVYCCSLLCSAPAQVGRMDSEKPAAIRLSGESILEEHCEFESVDGKVTIFAMLNSVTVCRISSHFYLSIHIKVVLEWEANITRSGKLSRYMEETF